MPSPKKPIGGGLHWFRVEFRGCTGHCFITTGEALHLRQLNCEWVRQALLNLAAKQSLDWLEGAVRSEPGLMLSHSDAHEHGAS